jgi:hypothetical protein
VPKQYRPDIVLTGGRSGEFVLGLKGPPNSYVRGGGDRVFETDGQGKVVREISLDRVKHRRENNSPTGAVFERSEEVRQSAERRRSGDSQTDGCA